MKMPELPEVETIRQVLMPQLAGRTITNISVRHPDVIAASSAPEFIEALTGAVFTTLERRGKFLIAKTNKGNVIIHLRMTGCLIVAPENHPEEKHTHLVFSLSDKKELRFSDTRRFGRFYLIRNENDMEKNGITRLGPEPFSPEMNQTYIYEGLHNTRRAVKTCLMDQSFIAGIGNIYADEILFRAAINPLKAGNRLSEEEVRRLFSTIAPTLLYFIDKNRITPEDYLQTKGKEYRNTPYLQIYGHEGEPCPRCGTRLEHTVVGGRGSTYCPVCQCL